MARRKLECLNLLDDFLFGSTVGYPVLGEKFSRILLKIILGQEVGHLKVVPQKVYYGSDTDLHGTRMDVYLEDEDAGEVSMGTSYDIEPELMDDGETINSLPRRVRFYRAKIDSKKLKAGEPYSMLRNVFIIIITPYDPFDKDRMLYKVKNMCREEPDMEYEDGAATLYLYTKGTKGNPSKELQQLLRYMEHTTEENAVNSLLRELHEIVKAVKRDEEVALQYMKIAEREKFLHDQAIREGKAEGIAEGIAQGKAEGIAQGKAQALSQAIDVLMAKNNISIEEACDMLDADVEEYRKFKGNI